jgi:hypothetical protein
MAGDETSLRTIIPRSDEHAEGFGIELDTSYTQLSMSILSPTVRLTRGTHCKWHICTGMHLGDLYAFEILHHGWKIPIYRISEIWSESMSKLAFIISAPGIQPFLAIQSYNMFISTCNRNKFVLEANNLSWSITFLPSKDIPT